MNLLAVVKQVKAATLVIHGSADHIIPLKDSADVFDALTGVKEMKVIDGADHLMITQAQQITKIASEWIVKHLK